ncbi:MAG: acyl-ACP--UDP-N-acetylglucosamine O-acyltransferase [Alphaproteobacteria bacterium]|nr:acyl-ACP--UDP-N-acetylglucosamine O-acyltransferase [Alphaproteobacteria bacterium]
MSENIHLTAIVEDGAKVADSAYIGPYCIVGKDVELKDNVRLEAHVTVSGQTTIGEGTRVFQYTVLGLGAQHLKYMDEPGKLIIGKNNVIREHVTMHVGTPIDNHETIVGDNGLFMVGAHIAHDCIVGNNVIFTNNATIGGHVVVGDFAILGGIVAVHQRCRIGKYAMIGGMSGVEGDVIPYGMVIGGRGRLSGLNVIGLKRRGFSRDDIRALRRAYRLLFAPEGTMAERISDVTELYKDNEAVMDILNFIKESKNRSVCQPKN